MPSARFSEWTHSTRFVVGSKLRSTVSSGPPVGHVERPQLVVVGVNDRAAVRTDGRGLGSPPCTGTRKTSHSLQEATPT